MLQPRLLLAATLLSLSGTLCASAQDGSSDKEMMRLLARPRQLLFPDELRGNCAGLAVTLKTHVDRLRELEKRAKKEGEGPPPPLFGGRPAVADSAKERDRVEALNVVLQAKGCQPVNIDEEMLKAPPVRPTNESDRSDKKRKNLAR